MNMEIPTKGVEVVKLIMQPGILSQGGRKCTKMKMENDQGSFSLFLNQRIAIRKSRRTSKKF